MDSKKLIALLKQYPVAVAALGGALVFALLLYFTMDALSAREQRYRDLEQQIDIIRQNEINAFGLVEEVEAGNRIVQNIESRLIREEAKASHYQNFLGLAEGSGVVMADPSPGALLNPGAKGVDIETKQFAQMEYGLMVEGGFREVLDFLYRLKSGGYLVRVTRMTLTTKRQGELNRVSAELSIRVLAPKQEIKTEGKK